MSVLTSTVIACVRRRLLLRVLLLDDMNIFGFTFLLDIFHLLSSDFVLSAHVDCFIKAERFFF